jgi:hypothetical protein
MEKQKVEEIRSMIDNAHLTCACAEENLGVLDRMLMDVRSHLGFLEGDEEHKGGVDAYTTAMGALGDRAKNYVKEAQELLEQTIDCLPEEK